MRAKSISGNTAGEIKDALEKSMVDGFVPTIAVVFISIKQDRRAVCDILYKKGIDVIGATSSGEFINGHQSEGEAAIMLFDINKSDYCILFEDIGERTLNEAATNMAKTALQKFNKPAFILCSTLMSPGGKMIDGETLVRTIEKTVGPHVNLFGGMAGDDITFTGTYVFTHDLSTDHGMAALILNEEKINLYGVAFSGWKPMGISRTITKSEANLIYTIDDQPALDIYLRFLGKDKSSDDNQVKFFDSIGIHYPFQVQRDNREPMMCTPIGYNREKGALICESNVTQGSKFRFSTPPDFDIIETVINKASELKRKIDTGAEALLIFSCAGRLSALGPMAQDENEGLAAVWDAPMAGFYTYGEFGRAINGKHEFHSTTNSWVALKEK
ncbi:MAG TPA: FIST N-terminal domain-containing protein [Chitinophagaceae bacterium]|nr:FIST N-terminal domain-containing protein [Chitinophagaceae bacterium]